MTNKAVPSTDPADLVLNAGILDQVVNSTAQTFTDRLGVVKPTVLGAIQTLQAFNNRGVWAATTVYAVKDLVSNAGTWYVCVVVHTSSAAFATDTATKWRVYQGVAAADLAAPTGSALVGLLQSGAGAVARTALDKLRESVSVKDFGATGDGTTDDTAAIQLAANAVTSGILFFPKGTYKVTAAVTLPNAITCRGEGKYATAIKTTSATAHVFICTATSAYEFSDMTIQPTVTRTGGDYIRMAPSSLLNNDSAFRRINFTQPYIGINFLSASGFAIEDCYFAGYVSIGVSVANAYLPDSGDSYAANNTFDGSGASGVAISQSSSGGLKLIGNKFLAGAYHYLGQFNTGASSTSILVFEGNSSENASVANVAFSSSASTSFGRVLINNNQFSIAAAGTGVVVSDPGYAWLDGVTIDGNQFAFGAGSTGINIARATRVSIGKNTYLGNGTSTGVVIGANVGSGVIGFQDFQNITTEWSGTFTNITFNPPRLESGTGSGTTNIAYGGLYAASAGSVTFAKPFAKAPSVSANTTAAGGGVSVLLGTPTTTGFSYQIVGATNGGACSMTWTAQG